MQKYFLYARKSTDVEDKQVLSIEAQLAELRAFAKKEGLWIIETIIEKQSAKIPGRRLFNAMLDRIEKGEADGIISWHPDRLARNSVDGGKIIYLLDIGKLKMLKFNTFWFDNTPQGKFMLNMAFGQSKYYVDNLSENTKRGLRQKVRNGIYPSLAPIGYLNNVKKKMVEIDRRKSVIIQELFELYAQGKSSLEDMAQFLADHGIFSKGGKRLKGDRIPFILTNPFYYGHFKYGGELHEGKHTPIISKQLFDKVQEVLKNKGRAYYKLQSVQPPFLGLLYCASCGMMVTGEYRLKKQKNGNEHHYVYYHCTKKNKTIKCPEPCIRQEALDKQVSSFLKEVTLSQDWANQLLAMVEKDETEEEMSSSVFTQKAKTRLSDISTKLKRLLDSYLEQDIEREVYLAKKSELMSEKKTLEEKSIHFEKNKMGWIEPMKEWIKEAQLSEKVSQETNLAQKKVFAKKVFGSNLRLASQKVVAVPANGETSGSFPRASRDGKFTVSPARFDSNQPFAQKIENKKTAYDALRQTLEVKGKSDEKPLLVHPVGGYSPPNGPRARNNSRD